MITNVINSVFAGSSDRGKGVEATSRMGRPVRALIFRWHFATYMVTQEIPWLNP